MERKLTETES